MSKQGDDERQYRCLRKYEEIVKQVILLDELAHESMEARSKLQKRKKNSKGSEAEGSSSSTEEQGGNVNQVFVDTITRFLHDLNPNANPNPNPAPHRKPSTNKP